MNCVLQFFENQPVLTLLRNQPVLTVFAMLGCGYLIGNICFASFSLSPLAGVLFVGLLAGELTSSPTLAAAQQAIRGGSVAPPRSAW